VLNRLFGIGDAATPFGRALLQVRYRALQRQIPLLYLIALANLVGLIASSGLGPASIWHPANLLILGILVRLVHWMRSGKKSPEPGRIQRELRITFALAAVLSLSAGYWAIELLLSGSPKQQDLVILFAALAAIGCSYGVSSFPAAARLPLLLFALPLALVLAFSPNPAHLGVGVCLALITLATLRLHGLQSRGLVELVRSQTIAEEERQRAFAAEQAALAEKARVREIADTDSLTGLPNRRAFLAALEARLGGGERFALALLDLDGFKPINDVFGHAVGDGVLAEVARRLSQGAQDGAIAARIGGDEFALIIPGGGARAVRTGERLCRELGRSYRIDGRELRISACCGIVAGNPGESDLAAMLRRADAALYAGKQEGRGRTALFTTRMERANDRRTEIERALRDPAVDDAIKLVFQPIYDLEQNRIAAFEALARWTHPTLGTIGPDEFIAVAEQAHVIDRISNALLARAAAEAQKWPDDIGLSFNVSAVQLCTVSAAEQILGIVVAAGLDPARLKLEVTETSLMVDIDGARRNLERLRAAGVRIVLDDFGAGYASISYLREMSFDAIKIDGSLVVDADSADPAFRLLRGVIDMCASIGVPCVAEHIERQEQLDLVRRLGCRFGQGYALSHPLSPKVASELAGSRVVAFPGKKTATRAA
jgi:diguanylate cyclase (GGDEF)-like protein